MGEEKSIKLCRANANHVETLLKVLEYDGRVEGLPVFATAMFVSPADDPDRKKAKKRKRYSDESDSGHKRNDRHRKRRKRDSSSDTESTDDRSSKRKRGYGKSKKHRSTPDSEGSGPRSDDDITRAHSRRARSPGPAPLTPTLGPIRPSWSRRTRSKLPSIVPFDPRPIIKPPVPILLRAERWALKT